MKVVIVDYGMGNLRSVAKACHSLGYEVSVQPTLEGADKAILPGVGAFGAAMANLQPIVKDLVSFARSGQPFLGICLGQQLMFEASEEHGEHEGLGLLPGRVKYLPQTPGLKVPHTGWSSLNLRGKSMFDGIDADDHVYFVHSLYCESDRREDISAECSHGVAFTAAVQSQNIWGTQFHPEKSGRVGLRILENFLSC